MQISASSLSGADCAWLLRVFPMRLFALLSVGVFVGCKTAPPPAPPPLAADALKDVTAFDSIASPEARSRALFVESTKVLLHPRCSNCHPSVDTPLQGMDQHEHFPKVTRGPTNEGVVGMQCTTCHQTENQPHIRVPGAPKWHLAPREMAWVGRTPAELCAQLKDPTRNGARSLEAVLEHVTHDELVAWAWNPGAGREPAPGSQRQFGALIAAWIQTGAHCPEAP